MPRHLDRKSSTCESSSQISTASSPAHRGDSSHVGPVIALAIPVALSSQLDTLAGLADVYLVGHLGADAISAVGVSQIITMVVGVVMISVSTGAFTMVAQAIGARSAAESSATTKQALALVALISIGLSLIGATSAPAPGTAQHAGLGRRTRHCLLTGLPRRPGLHDP